ncbi:hypothetical protein [Halovivax sp.]|uniref:hypothetical protein n=1 Tax=Halovivax sp. TaxID=1935978 RepID=UPI0025BA068C|nr:hypothetical protein [Halovivax sp.]
MLRTKGALVGALGVVIGTVTLRKLRSRRSNPREEATTAAKAAADEAAEAVEHAAASLDHAREAKDKAVEAAGDEFDGVRAVVGEEEPASRSARFREAVGRVGRR